MSKQNDSLIRNLVIAAISACIAFYAHGVFAQSYEQYDPPVLINTTEANTTIASLLNNHLEWTGDSDIVLSIAVANVDINSLRAVPMLDVQSSDWPMAAGSVLVGGTVRIAAFGETFDVVFQHVEETLPGIYTYSGRVEGGGLALFTLDGDSAIGLVDAKGVRVLVEPLVDQDSSAITPLHVAKKLDLAALARATDVVIEDGLAKTHDGVNLVKGNCAGNPRVLVIYTAAVAAERTMPGFVSDLISSMNTSFSTSGVAGSVSLAHSSEVNYMESGDDLVDASDDLFIGCCGLEDVDELMQTWDADFSILLVDDDAYTGQIRGVAFFHNEFAPYAVVADDWAQADFTFSHEAGHVFAGKHSWATSDPNPFFSWGRGYFRVSGGNCDWQTMMGAYGMCDGDLGTPRLNIWSNPDRDYLGHPTGRPIGFKAEADMRNVLNATLPCVAEWTGDPPPPDQPAFLNVTPLTCFGQNALIWGDSAGASEYEAYRSPNPSLSPRYLVYRGPALGVTLNLYPWQSPSYVGVRACNGSGCSGFADGDEPATFYFGCP